MKIIRKTIPSGTIEEFAKHHDLTMVVWERPLPCDDSDRFYAYFQGCKIVVDCRLKRVVGNGLTEEAAIKNYAEQISCKSLNFDAKTDCRRLMDAWRFI